MDKEWLKKWKGQILDFVRDYANPNENDPYYTVINFFYGNVTVLQMSRHKDWYMGHSWASGLFVFGGMVTKKVTIN